MTTRQKTQQTDAVSLLKQDHRKVKKAFERYQELGPQAYKTKKSLADEICEELIRHTQIEEEVFYPEFRKAVKEARPIANEAKVEHDSARELIHQILEMDAEEELFDAKVKVLSEQIEHHIKEEEEEMFPMMKKTRVDLQSLASRMEERKEQLSQQN